MTAETPTQTDDESVPDNNQPIAGHEIEQVRSLVAGLHDAETVEELDEMLLEAGTHISHLREQLGEV
jgi:hypothetical protein